MKALKPFIFLLFFTLISLQIKAAKISSNAVSGNWNNTATWSGGVIPVAGDTVTIVSGAVITIDQDVDINKLTISGDLIIGNDGTVRTVIIRGTLTIDNGASLTVGSTDALHSLTVQGDITNNGSMDLYNSSSQASYLILDGDLTISGNTPEFFKTTFNSGTVTSSVALNIQGDVIIEDGATWNAGTLTHNVYGNWTENGTGALSGNCTINMANPLVQQITANAVFYNLNVNGGGILINTAYCYVNNDLVISNNSEMRTTSNVYIRGNMTVNNGALYTASGGTTYFDVNWRNQELHIGTTNSQSAAQFYRLQFDSGKSSGFKKTVFGNLELTSYMVIGSDASVDDDGDTHVHKFNGGAYMRGECLFSGTVYLSGGTYRNDNGSYGNFNFGTAQIIVDGYCSIAADDTLTANKDVEITQRYLVLNSGSKLIGQSGYSFKLRSGANLYVRGADNFPEGFSNDTLESGSWVRYDASMDQTVRGNLTYGYLYIGGSSSDTKTADGPLDIDNSLYLYQATLDLGSYSHTIAGNIYNNDNNYNGSLTSTGTVTFDAEDGNQTIYNGGTGTYTFNNLVFTSTATSTIRYKYIYDDLTINGNFTVSNANGDSTRYITVRIYDHTLNNDGGDDFNLGSYVKFETTASNNFENTAGSFANVNLDPNSTIIFAQNDGATQYIPAYYTYGNVELWGNGVKQVKTVLGMPMTIKGDIRRTGYTPIFTDNNINVSIEGDWLLGNNYVNLTATLTLNGANQEITGTTLNNVIFSGSGTKLLKGTLTVKGDLTINDNITVNADNRTIYIQGDWDNNSTGYFHQDDATTVFDGDDKQIVKSNSSSYFGNLSINKTGTNDTLELGSDIRAKLNLEMYEDAASLNLKGYTLTVGRDFNVRKNCHFIHSNGTVVLDGDVEDQVINNLTEDTLVFYNIEMKNKGVKRFYNNIFKFEGNVTINNASVDGNWWDWIVLGNWSNTGNFSHYRTVYFEGDDQNISSSTFNSIYIGGTGTKTLQGNISLSGNLTIGDNDTLDVSVNNYNINIEGTWHNDSTGSFIAHHGTVTFTGNNAYLWTGEGNSTYGSSTNQLSTKSGEKHFYNLVINLSDADRHLILRGSLHVDNDFTLNQGQFWLSYDPNNYGVNDIYAAGNWINNSQINYYYYGGNLYLQAPAGTYSFTPGTGYYENITVNSSGAIYNLQGNLNLYNNRTFTLTDGTWNLNHYVMSTNSSGGNITLNGGELDIDSAAMLKVAAGATLTNAGATLKIVGVASNPASLSVSGSGTYTFVQTAGTIHAYNYKIESTTGNGIDIQGGTIDATDNFSEGIFSGGAGNAYLTLTDYDFGSGVTLTNVVFNSGPTYNVSRTSGNGAVTFENASGTLSGEAHDEDSGDPGTLINWSYPGAYFWTGASTTDNTDWNDPDNWSSNSVPDANANVYLNHQTVTSAYNVYIKNADAVCKNLTIDAEGGNSITLELNGHTLDIGGNITIGSNTTLNQTNSSNDTIWVAGSWSNSGTFNEGTATVVFDPASGAQNITTGGSADPFYNLIIRASNATVTLGSNLDVDNDFSIVGGIFDASSNYTINVGGNWTTVGGTFEPRTSTVIFDKSGATTQTIEGGEFYNFQTSNSSTTDIATKQLTANITVKHDLQIDTLTTLDGGSNLIFVGHYWRNYEGNAGLTQTGGGTVIFNGGWQIIGDNDYPTTFNHLTINGTSDKRVRQNITVNGNLTVIAGNLYIEQDGSGNDYIINGAGSNNTLQQTGGNIMVQGSNNFPQNFENINITGGNVQYYADIDQHIYPTNYNYVYLRRVTSGVQTTKTADGDFSAGTVNIYDTDTKFDLNGYKLTISNNLYLATNGRTINWGATGTVMHTGGTWYVDGDITEFNNVIKAGTGYMWLRYHSLKLTGNLTINNDAGIRMDTTTLECTATGKSFTMVGNAYAYIYTPETVGSRTGLKAFPTGFDTYNLNVNSRVYLYGTGDQTIFTTPTYGNLYLYSNDQINMTLDGNLDVNGEFRMRNDPTLIDNGYNINIAGANIDIRNYTPSSGSTFTLDGSDQTIWDGQAGTQDIEFNNLVCAGTGTKTFTGYNDNIVVNGDLTINTDVTVYTSRNWTFSGSTWTNNGTYNQYTNTTTFSSSSAQTVDAGADNNFYGVQFSGNHTTTFTNNGIVVGNGIFKIDAGTVDMGSGLTHSISSTRVENSGTWTTDNANFIFTRNGTQYLPAMTCQNIEFTSQNGYYYARYLEGDLHAKNITINTASLRASADANSTTPTYDIYLTGNWINNGYYYAWGNTTYFDADNSTGTSIQSGDYSYFNNVEFNKNGTATRTFTMQDDMWIQEDMTINSDATLFTNGHILKLGNDDPNDPDAPPAETHLIDTYGTLKLDAGSKLLLDCHDDGNPQLDVAGTLELIGASGNNVVVDRLGGGNRISININNHGTLKAKYYHFNYLSDEGLTLNNGSTLDATYNLSEGTWSNMNTSSAAERHYLSIYTNPPSTNVENVVFNFAGTPTIGKHYNVYVNNSSVTDTIHFAGDIGGTLAGETYEKDPDQDANGGEGLIKWPPVSEVTWTGAVSSDWFDPQNWSPAAVPDANTNANIPLKTNNPVINASGAVCKSLIITNGNLQITGGYDLVVNKDLTLGTQNYAAILSVTDPNSSITVGGNWTKNSNAVFVAGKGTVIFNATQGTVTITPRNGTFNNITFNGGATFILAGSSIDVDGDFTISNGSIDFSTNWYSLYIAGNYTNSGGTFNNTANGTVYLDGADQTITNGTFYRLSVGGTGTKTFATANSIANDFRINSTLLAAAPIDMNGNVYIADTASFNDGGFSHTFSGYHWYGDGSYLGSGTVTFDRNGTQYIHTAKFNNLVLDVGGAKILSGNVDVTGNVTCTNNIAYFNVDTLLLKNTAGTGTFTLEGNRTIYVRGANNFPKNFSTYKLSASSYTRYDGNLDQSVDGISYGHLYLDYKTKTLAGNIDVNGIIYIYDNTTLDVSTNNYRINVAGHWYNNNGGNFICRQGEVVMDGTNAYPGTNQYIYLSTGTNDFYRLTINREDGTYLRLYYNDYTIKENLRVLSGICYLQNGYTAYVGGNLSALTGTFYQSGTYYLNKASGTAYIQMNGSQLNNLTINSGAEYQLQDDMTILGSFDLQSGVFDGNGKNVQLGNGGEVISISGTYKIGAGGSLILPDQSSFNLNSGSEFYAVGTSSAYAKVTNLTGRYYFNVEAGATIHAQYYIFEFMGSAGIYIKDGAIIDNVDNFSNGSFANPQTGGTCLRIENGQSFTQAGGNAIMNVNFPTNPGNGTYNVTKRNSNTGTIEFVDYTGELGGEDFDDDAYDLIDWIGPVTLTWTGAKNNDWYDVANWHADRGADKVPTTNEYVIIPSTTNQPVITSAGAEAKSINLESSAYLTLNVASGSDTSLYVAEDINIDGTLLMNNASDRLKIGGNWTNNGTLIASDGEVIMMPVSGSVSINNGSQKFFKLKIAGNGTVQLSRNTYVADDFTIESGSFDVSASNYNLYVAGDFTNNATFIAQHGKVIFNAQSGTQIINTGSSDLYNIEFSGASSAVYQLNNNLTAEHNIDLTSGEFQLNSNTLTFGDGSGTDLFIITGKLNCNADAQILMGNNAGMYVNSGGTLQLVGTDFDHTADIRAQISNSTYALTINSGGNIAAEYYKIENTNTDGLHLASGANINSTYNLSKGIYTNGASGGQYIWLENDFSDFTVDRIYFNQGADINVKRLSGSGIITLRDATGVRAGVAYEEDNPDGGLSTGLVQWEYSNLVATWTGAVDTIWNKAANWDLSDGTHAVPDEHCNIQIPDVSSASGNFPVLYSTADGLGLSLTIFENAKLTIDNGYNLTIDSALTISKGTLKINSGSASTISVGDIWASDGTFIHGGSSTVKLTASTGSFTLDNNGDAFYNLEINSGGSSSAEFATNGNLVVDGNLTISTGTLKVNNSSDTIKIGGNWQNDANFVHGNGKVVLNGSSHTISGTSTTSFYDLQIESGTTSLSQNIMVNKDLTINDNVDAGSATIELKGNLYCTANFTPSTSTLLLSGTNTQTITTSNTLNLNNLTVNNTASTFPQIILRGNVNVQDNATLSLTDGIIETSSNNEMLTIGSGVTLTGGNTSASFISGPLTKTGSDNFTFPIGKGAKFARLGVSAMSAAATLVAEYFDTPYSDISNTDATTDHVSGLEYWNLQRTSGTGEPTVTLYWENGSQSGIDDLPTLSIASYYSGQWNDMGQGSTTGDVNTGSITAAGSATNFGPFTFSSTDATTNPLNSVMRWDGSESTDWNDPNNWTTQSTPTSSSNVIIPAGPVNQPVISVTANCRNITIDENAHLTINPNYSLTVANKLIINGKLTIKSDANGTGALLNTVPITYGSNYDVHVERYIEANNWHYMSAAVDNASSSLVQNATSYYNHNFLIYDETNTDADYMNGWTEYTGIMQKGVGYAVYMDVSMALSLPGHLNSGDINVNVSNTDGAADANDEGWNLIGNPYPSPIDADAFLAANNSTNGTIQQSIDGTVYFWDDGGAGGGASADYATWNGSGSTGSGSGTVTPDGKISVGQGFFVHKTGNGSGLGSVTFTNSMRIIDQAHYYKKAEKQKQGNPLLQRIKLAVSDDNGLYNEILLAFRPEADDGYDALYDALKMKGNANVAFYSMVDNYELAIQTQSYIDYESEPRTIPLGIDLAQSGNYKITVPMYQHFGADTKIYLEDKLTQQLTLLKPGTVYKFSSDSGKITNRFYVRIAPQGQPLNPSDTTIAYNQTSINGYRNHIQIRIKQKESPSGTVQVYDISGRLLKTLSFEERNYIDIEMASKAGIYLVNLKFKDGEQASGKVFLSDQ